MILLILKSIHLLLFKDLMPNKSLTGEFRTYNISKREEILNGNSVQYTPFYLIQETLEWDSQQESAYDYSLPSREEKLEHIASFISGIWQIHPFAEGNTRTILLFLIGYIKQEDYSLELQYFKENPKYFRDAFVLDNVSSRRPKNRRVLMDFLNEVTK